MKSRVCVGLFCKQDMRIRTWVRCLFLQKRQRDFEYCIHVGVLVYTHVLHLCAHKNTQNRFSREASPVTGMCACVCTYIAGSWGGWGVEGHIYINTRNTMQTSVSIHIDLSYINDTYLNVCILAQKSHYSTLQHRIKLQDTAAHCNTESNYNTLQHNYMEFVSLHADPTVEGLFCKRVLSLSAWLPLE